MSKYAALLIASDETHMMNASLIIPSVSPNASQILALPRLAVINSPAHNISSSHNQGRFFERLILLSVEVTHEELNNREDDHEGAECSLPYSPVIHDSVVRQVAVNVHQVK